MSEVLTATTDKASGTCTHRWLIGPAAGPTSQGTCSRCGTKRDFFNDPEQARRDKAAPVDDSVALD